ncbi:ubiquitin fusion degradation protein [Colletotrichum graminicola]|uniref:Ubiquitin fusion degradation protein n=1 Tax=Colletotrichum graminicola (strain M1.001 / M2 / FGSC 10212) TaxID=645133 RepID=E3QZT4_COLGM|nr:ubiquitin fusion degradation protein [Colletotrichum graminicola M1.001]EFQ36372.1 ubiquitin fusion degradation protein [Colletotrichum graminicola M1.001]WDK22439.1 ubiquitin fusion degradation protein [Colletotrichum graminicola]
MEESQPELKWSAPFAVLPPSQSAPRDLRGDKILLPPSALEQLLAASPRPPAPANSTFTSYDPFNPYARHHQTQYHHSDSSQQLPNPLMFRLVNQNNGNIVYAGIREFSADDGEIALAPYLMEALGILPTDFGSETSSGEPIDATDDSTKHTQPRVTVHANQLPKGTYVRLRPLEAGYDPDDWKSLLERQLRESYTTLTKGTVLSVRGVKGEDFKFLVDKFLPEGDGICVVDTDLEVDIEALNEEQARETMRQIMAKAQPGTANGSSKGSELDVWKPAEGQVLPGEYVDYELPSWDRTRPLTIELSELSVPDSLDLFISPKSARQRAQPRDFEHIFSNFAPSQDGRKAITIRPTNIELENAEQLLIAVHGYPLAGGSEDSVPVYFRLRAKAEGEAELHDATVDLVNDETRPIDEEQCKNCLQWVPKRTLVLHQNFCLRNNILCTRCRHVFKKGSLEWEAHWHCEHDDAHGDSSASKAKHDYVRHTERQCPSCEFTAPSLVELALHRTSVCPGKLILCQFCHLEVPQEGDPLNPSAETILSGLTAHELADGARTTDCHLCQKIVRMRDMTAHMKHHELDKVSRSKPAICRNANCGRTLHGVGSAGSVGAGTAMGQGPGNDLGLCSLCFGPLYVSMHDPEGKALRRRIERRYLGQLMTGCGKKWCGNEWCRSGRANLGLESKGTSAQAALPIVKPLVQSIPQVQEPIYFCVDEASQRRRKLAEMLAGEGVWDFEWCLAACEAATGDLDKAREWLVNWAPTR